MVLCALQEGSSYCMQERKDQKSLSRHPEAEEISKDLSQTILSHYDHLLPFLSGVFYRGCTCLRPVHGGTEGEG
jgi:hypothetical protein